MLKPATYLAIYRETLQDLKAHIEAHSSVNAFCHQHNIDRPNVVKAFSALREAEISKKMSLGTYIRICVGLGLIDASALPPADNPKAFDNIPLDTYLMLKHSDIYSSILAIKFQ